MIGPAKGFGQSVTSSYITIDEISDRVEKHQVFGTGKRFTVGASATVDITFSAAEGTAYPFKHLHILPFLIKAYGGGPLNITMYVAPTITTPGTQVPLRDRNSNPPIVTPHSVLRLAPAVSSPGTAIDFEDSVFSAAGLGAHAALGNESQASLILIPNPALTYLIRIVNTSTAAASAVLSMNIMEFNY